MRVLIRFPQNNFSAVARAVIKMKLRFIVDPPVEGEREMSLSFSHPDHNRCIALIAQALSDRTFPLDFFLLSPEDEARLYPQEHRVVFHHVDIIPCNPRRELPPNITVGYPC